MKLYKSVLATIILVILRQIYLSYKINDIMVSVNKYATYILFAFSLFLFYFFKNDNVSFLDMVIIIFIIMMIRMIYRFIIGKNIDSGRFDTYNTAFFVLGVFSYSYLVL